MYPVPVLQTKARHGDRTEVFSGLTLASGWGTVSVKVQIRTTSGRLLLTRALGVTNETDGTMTIEGLTLDGADWTTGGDTGIPLPSNAGTKRCIFDVEVTSSEHGVQTVAEGEIIVHGDYTR